MLGVLYKNRRITVSIGHRYQLTSCLIALIALLASVISLIVTRLLPAIAGGRKRRELVIIVYSRDECRTHRGAVARGRQIFSTISQLESLNIFGYTLGSQEILQMTPIWPSALVQTPHMPPAKHTREDLSNIVNFKIYSTITHTNKVMHWFSNEYFLRIMFCHSEACMK